MKKGKNAKKRLVLLILELCLFMLIPNSVFAISSKEEKIVTPGNIKEWNDGALVTKQISGKAENYEAIVSADTTGLEEDYYSVYIYDYTKRYIKSYDGIRFQYTNPGDIELEINLTLTVDAKTSVTMTEDSFAIIEDTEKETTDVLEASYGTLTIPPHFNGMVYIPFSQLYNENGENITLNNIQSWGITTVIEKEQQVSYTIGNIAFLEDSVSAMKDSSYLITLSGEEQVVLPNTGSVIEKYETKVLDLEGNEVDDDITFYLEEDIEGVKLAKNGALEIQSNCVATKLTLYAKTSQSINAGKLSLSLERVSADVAAVGVPKVEDVSKITSTAYNQLNDFVIPFRIGAVVIFIFLGAIFLTWFSEAKANYQIIKRKLYKIFQEQEEEEEP